MCGVATTCGSLASAQSAGGSFSKTSSAAAATMPCSIARLQRRLVDQLAARRVDDPDARLHPRKAVVVEEMLRLGRRRQMERQEVGGRAHLVERQQLDAHALGDLARDERIVGDDAHAERAGALRHLLADAPEAGDAERLAAQLGAEKPLLLPLAVLHRPIGGGNAARERQHQGAGVLGDADAVRARRVDDEDAARAGRGDVDVVHAGAGAGDDAELAAPPASRSAVTLVALRTSSASASASAAASSAAGRPLFASTCQPGSARSSSSAEAGRSSATTIFMVVSATWWSLGRGCGRSSLDSICRWSECGCHRRACPSAGRHRG